MFTSQCPYKTPLFKDAISRLRVTLIALPRMITSWLYWNTSRERFPKLRRWFSNLDDVFLARQEDWNALEEESISKNSSLSLPVVSYTRNLLQGERLRDSIEECLHSISDDDLKKAEEGIQLQSSPIHRMLPYIPDGPVRIVGSLLVEAAEDSRLHPIYFGQDIRPCMYLALTHLQSTSYNPLSNLPISRQSLPTFIHLIQANPILASFSFLTMYSIRHRILTNYPDSFDNLFDWLSNSEKLSYGIGELTVALLSPLQLI